MTTSYSLRYATLMAGVVEEQESWLRKHRRALQLYDLEDLYGNISALYEKVGQNVDRQMEIMGANEAADRKAEETIEALVTIFVKLVDRFSAIARAFRYEQYAGTKIDLALLDRKKQVALGCIGKNTSWAKKADFIEAAKKHLA